MADTADIPPEAFDYVTERMDAFRNLAEHFHEKAINSLSAKQAAQWVVLMDNCLWCASGEGDVSTFEGLFAADASA